MNRLQNRLRWLPEGMIALVSDRAGNPDIYLMNAVTGELANLTNTPDLREADPAWSPDGSRLAFTENDGQGNHIAVMNADGTERRIVTEGVTPAWSADGRRLYFSTHHRQNMGNARDAIYFEGIIGSVDLNGDDFMPLTEILNPRDNDSASNPAVSPDGQAILFQVRERFDHLEQIDADGQNRTFFARDWFGLNTEMKEPAWSPDGRQVAFFAAPDVYESDPPTGLYVSGIEQQPALLVQGFLGNPSWSPDGEYLAYDAMIAEDANYQPQWAVIITTSDGDIQHRMTPEDSFNYYSPAWHPD